MAEPAPARGDADLDAMSYEQLVEALESMVSRMSGNDVGIEEVADLYEQAAMLRAAAAERLERVRRRIEDLTSAGGPDHGEAPVIA